MNSKTGSIGFKETKGCEDFNFFYTYFLMRTKITFMKKKYLDTDTPRLLVFGNSYILYKPQFTHLPNKSNN